MPYLALWQLRETKCWFGLYAPPAKGNTSHNLYNAWVATGIPMTMKAVIWG